MKTKNFCFILIFLIVNVATTYSQVGINTNNPQALLHIKENNANNPNNTEGIIIPRLNNFPTVNPTSNQNGMLFFLNTVNNFYYWNNINGDWIKLETNNNKHYVGEFFGGGIVAYTYDNGRHGLILSLEDLSATGVTWGNRNVTTGAVSAFDGAINTNAILSSGGATATDAAGLCDNYSYGGFTDWYLPASWEFFNIFSNAYAINKILENDGNPSTTGIYHPGKYWTSTETAGDRSRAYAFFTYGNYAIITYKDSNIPRVRAVRVF